MSRSTVTLVISRVLFIAGGVGVLVFGYWFVQTALAPVPVPPAPIAPKSVTFDRSLDISKSDTFNSLHPLGPSDTSPQALGRTNPFMKAEPPIRIPETNALNATTTATSTVNTATSTAR